MNDDLISRKALMPLFMKKANTMKDRHGVKLGEEWLLNYNDIKDVLDNAPTVERPQKWETIGGGEWVLKDHYWYLIAHKDYGTPMKAKYHSDCPHFTFFDANGEQTTYLFENKITHYMELPDIPTGGTKNEL